MTDEDYMRMALNMGQRGLGFVAPNPSVGCVIVKDDVIVGRGRTAEGGRPHAEAAALAHARADAKGATAYVTLEPCAEHGREGPCAAALIKAGVSRVVIACYDLNPAVYKKGVQILEDAGVEVTYGVLEDEARETHKGFFLRIAENRPYVTLKQAVSSDDKIASAIGERTQISGELAQRYMHLQRSRHDAILVGSGTYLADQPKLTTRLQGVAHDPLRLVLDRRKRVGGVDGFEVLDIEKISDVLSYLADKGVTRLLVEGGAQTHRSFMESGFVDEFQVCQSPKTLGGKGVYGISQAEILAVPGLKYQKTRMLGEDRLEIYRKGL